MDYQESYLFTASIQDNITLYQPYSSERLKEIAETLEVSPKTVDYRIQQALKQLRIDLKDYLPLLLPLLFP